MRNPFKRQDPEPLDLDAPVDIETAKKAAAFVNAGDVERAKAICNATDNPRGTTFAAYRYINVE